MDSILNMVAIQPPRHRSESLPHLPQEVYEHIIDFLWYDISALARCCLVCSAFLPVAAYHLARFHCLRISSHASAALYARALRAKEYRRISNQIKSILMHEDPRSPFIHRFSISIPGCYLSELRELNLFHLDWTITRPHVCFFDCLTLYSGVTRLWLQSCTFKNASQLRRLINALPSLKTLSLSAIDGSTLMDVPTTTVSHPTLRVNRTLQYISLESPPECTGLSSLTGTRVRAIRNILAFCAQYSSISRLTLDILFIDSLTSLLQLLHNLPLVSDLMVRGYLEAMSVDVSEWQGFELEHADLVALHLTRNHFSNFCLICTPTIPALGLMKLLATPEAHSKLESLRVDHSDSTGPVAQLLQAVTDTLLMAGKALRRFDFRWDFDQGPLTECVPGLNFAPNTSLEDVSVTLKMPPNPHMIESILTSVISSITSPYLKSVSVTLDVTDVGTSEAYQPVSGGDASRSSVPKALDDFHATLNASLFDNLARNSVQIRIPALLSTHTAAAEVIAPIRSRLDELFAPWLARNVLQLQIAYTILGPGTSGLRNATAHILTGTDEVYTENFNERDVESVARNTGLRTTADVLRLLRPS